MTTVTGKAAKVFFRPPFSPGFSRFPGESAIFAGEFHGYFRFKTIKNNMARKNQSTRLTLQHQESHGVEGIFGEEAKLHDLAVSEISHHVIAKLTKNYPQLTFRYRQSIEKKEINEALQKVDPILGQTLFVENASIIPDGGMIEVRDDDGNWRVVLVSEAKHQGKDIENIKRGKLVGKNKDQDLMAAGNAIERSHKNISEIANFMLAESHFPCLVS